MTDTLRTHVSDQIGWLTIDRPAARGALTRADWVALPGQLEELAAPVERLRTGLLEPMLCLTQMSDCVTFKGSFSSVSTATIARKGAFCSIEVIYKICIPFHLSYLKILLRENFSKLSSQFFKKKAPNFNKFQRKFR